MIKSETLTGDRSKQQLAFLVKFANADLSSLSGRQLSEWQKDLIGFFGTDITKISQGSINFVPTDPELQKYPHKKFATLQAEFKAILHAIDGRRMTDGGSVSPFIDIKLSYLFLSVGNGPDFLIADGSARDLFLQAAISLLLDRRRSARIRLCPECKQKYFLRIRRQLYCSRLCVDRVNHRDWFETEGGQKYLKKLKRRRRIVRAKKFHGFA
jgi:hypothetical protein